ncbi:hypothetical protein [Parasitella parasitica]|uniref:Uncharacterized protein n=1 Tax=Parasitella parasitica TaxID=35722 RepID=A0A0B7NDZ6_9FUNG|nr:hypothetical protein [Parasitella parasitica]CEP16716.1 hypothetical protein [Parasitella parasitica]CEP16717.1 hypothetical protein [Parasitella parasitica]
MKRIFDKCADGSRVGTQPKPVAFIRKKTRTGETIFEYTIRLGKFELLATSGFFGVCGSGEITLFFGSSVQKLSKSITERFDTLSSQSILISTRQFCTNLVQRLLNQYISQTFQNKGNEPAHPLTFDFANPTASVASTIWRTFVYQRLGRKEWERRLAMMKKTKITTKAAEIVPRYIEAFKSQVL